MINTNDNNQNIDDNELEDITQEQVNTDANEENLDLIQEASPDNYKEKFEDLQNRYLRLYADFENHKREVQVQRSQDERRYRKQIIVAVILPLLDHLKLATDYAPKSQDPALVKYLQSVENILKTSIEDVKKIGAQIIIPNVRDDFDENIMEAISVTENPEFEKSHTVINVVSFGLKIEDVVISPAKVIISA